MGYGEEFWDFLIKLRTWIQLDWEYCFYCVKGICTFRLGRNQDLQRNLEIIKVGGKKNYSCLNCTLRFIQSLIWRHESSVLVLLRPNPWRALDYTKLQPVLWQLTRFAFLAWLFSDPSYLRCSLTSMSPRAVTALLCCHQAMHSSSQAARTSGHRLH